MSSSRLIGLLVAPLVLLGGAATYAGADETVAKDPGRATLMFTFKDRRIVESSGIETATNFRRILYTHNDSGDTSRFFAVGRNGATKAVYTLRNAGHKDWEDMSAGPNATLWFGDIGGNRNVVSVYRVKEPQKLRDRALAWKGFDFRYGDGGSHNAEALLVNPRNGTLMIVTKALSGAAFYKAKPPFSTRGTTTLRRVAPAPGPGKVTAASYSPDGRRFVVRTYGQAYFYKNLRSAPFAMGVPSGGEAIAYARYKSGVVVGREGVHAPVYRVRRPH